LQDFGELVAALCTRMGEHGGSLVDDPDARAAADATVAAVREGAGEERLRELFARLDEALRAAGLAHGLGAGEFRGIDPAGHYQRLPGVVGYAVHKVLRCPAPTRCARQQRSTWETRAHPPICAVHDLALVEERRRRA
jgi:hypothetical protein